MEKFAKIGEVVLYTGNSSYAYNNNTMVALDKFFKLGAEYEVRDVYYYNLYHIKCYRLIGYANLYPCKCFVMNKKELSKLIYGLK